MYNTREITLLIVNKYIDKSSSTLPLRVLRSNNENQIEPDEDGGLHTHYVEGPAKYYIGIIDILQEWTLTKRLERAIKIYIYRNDPYGISAMNPIDYARRFLRRAVFDTFEGIEEEEVLGITTTMPSFITTNKTSDSIYCGSATATHGSFA